MLKTHLVLIGSEFRRAVAATMPVILVALISISVLTLPDQITELYFVLFDDVNVLVASFAQQGIVNVLTSNTRVAQIATTYFAVMCFMMVMASIAFFLLLQQQLKYDLLSSLSAWTRVFVAVLTAFPLYAIALGIYLADEKAELPARGGSWAVLPYITGATFYTFVAAAVSLIFCHLIFCFAAWQSRSTDRHLSFIGNDRLAMVGIATVIVVVVLSYSPARIPQYLGSLAIICLFLSLFGYLLSAVVAHRHPYRRWVASVLIVSALASSAFNVNENHRVRHGLIPDYPPDLNATFLKWLEARKDLSFYRDRGIPYPVYFVSAEGGGITAAYHTANFLARMQDECPIFAQHVFGLSSVSGGSLGAAVFAGLAKLKAANQEWQPCRRMDKAFAQATREFFSVDFLAPLLAGTLFPDLLQRFIPLPIEALDRARALERTFELAWDRMLDPQAEAKPIQESYIRRPVEDLWSVDGASPALFLNTTSVANGARLTISPIAFSNTPTSQHLSAALPRCAFKSHGGSIQIPLSTAVSLSARFPWLTPPGWIEWRPPAGSPEGCAVFRNKIQLVDGAYFEDSGLELASELVSRLRRVVSKHSDLFPNGVQISLVPIFTKDWHAFGWWSSEGHLVAWGASELAAPLNTLLNTRRARTRAAHSRILYFDDALFGFGDEYFDAPDVEATKEQLGLPWKRKGVHNVMLDSTRAFMPLGWHFSKFARVTIETSASSSTYRSFQSIRNELMGISK